MRLEGVRATRGRVCSCRSERKRAWMAQGVARKERRRPREVQSTEPRTLAAAGFSSSAGQSSFTKSADVEEKIEQMIGKCLSSTQLALGVKLEGKVRDIYDAGDKLVIVTTDRQSGFDRLLTSVPFKGQVVNQTSVWWLENTKDLVENALLCSPHPNVAVMKKCQVFPVEFVVRSYLTGSTSTSIWTNYKSGARSYCGNQLKDGMRKNDKLDHNIVTPTTKSELGDKPITPQEIVDQSLMTEEHWIQASKKALQLFDFGQKVARNNGLLLVDTKYEFGVDDQGNVLLIDEIHTPDSSRFWLAASYESRHKQALEPENIDKEFIRLWYKDNCDPYNDAELPEAPKALVAELSRRYITLYETITGSSFVPASPEQYDMDEMARDINKHL